MHTVLVFLLGGLTYAVLEFSVAASVARWFPDKLHYLRSIGDALVQYFSKPTPDFSCDTGSVDDEITGDWPCQCPVCKKEWEKAGMNWFVPMSFEKSLTRTIHWMTRPEHYNWLDLGTHATGEKI